jgi:hypothetical protein
MRALLVVIALAATAFAQGNTLPYRVKQDDSLDVLAAEYYGDRGQSKLIVAENKLKQRRLQAGQRLRIPITREITTDRGDTYHSLAQTYLGDSRRAVMLADFNEQEVSDIPPIGTPLSIPIQITHVAQAPESFASIATLYWGDAKQADMLKRYNFVDKPQLEKGEAVIVPMLKVRVRKPQPLDGEAKRRRDDQHAATDEAERALPLARTAWVAADFAEVKAVLEPLAAKVDYLPTPQAIEVGILLGKSYLGLDDAEPANEAFTQALNRKPTHMLSPYYESPKVIEAWKKAGGQVTQ